METTEITNNYIKERRLVDTLLSRKPLFDGRLVAITTVIVMALVSQLFWLDLYGLASSLPAINRNVFIEGQWWRVFTAMFIHSDIGHFLSNMLLLSVFSFLISGYFGTKLFPLYSILLGGMVNAIAIYSYPLDVRLLGASGLVYLMGGVWLSLYFFIQRQYSVYNRILRITGISLMLFFPNTFMPNTSYRTHAIGLSLGIGLGIFYFYQNKKAIRSYEVYKYSLVEDVPEIS